MRSPASDGIAMRPARSANSRMTSAITTLATTFASRLRAPASLTMAVADIEPPTGTPCMTPATRFPTP